MGRQALVIAVGGFADDGLTVDDPAAVEAFDRLEFTTERAVRSAEMLRLMQYDLAGGGALIDIGRTALRDAIEALTTQPSPAIVHFIGHGWVDRYTHHYHLAGIDTHPGGTGVNICVHLDQVDNNPDGPPVLFVLDACGSGRAVRYAMGQDRRDDDRRAWVLAAAHADDPAYAGRFSTAFASVLERITAGQIDIDHSELYVRLEKVRDLVQEQLDSEPGKLRQMVEFNASSTTRPAPPFVPNPHYDQDAADLRASRLHEVPDPATRAVLDEIADPDHFRSRAYGLPRHNRLRAAPGLSRCLFTGRSSVMQALSAWLAGSANQTGLLRVVTGSPGSGKSAVLGALVCAAHPSLRLVAPEIVQRLSGKNRPPILDIEKLAVIHARNRDVDEILTSITSQLRLGDSPTDGWTAQKLTAAMEFPDSLPVLAMDALDEATDPAAVMREVLLPLVEQKLIKILVGVRPWSDVFAPLLSHARDDDALVDLDDVPTDTLRADLANYIDELLGESDRYMSNYDLRLRIAEAGAEALAAGGKQFGGQFLAAGLFADYVDSLPAPITDLDAVRAAVPDTLDKLLELRLERLGGDQPYLRPVLATIARAKGAGMPRSLIATTAAAFTTTDTEPRHQEIVDAIDAAWFYLRRSIDQDGTVLYRLFHQAFNDRLIAYPVNPQRPVTDQRAAAERMFDRLLAGLLLPTRDTNLELAWDRAEPYLLRHAIEHAADADRIDDLLVDSQFLVYAVPDKVYPYLTAANGETARAWATAYRTSLHHHKDRNSATRRDMLAVDAARWGLPTLTAKLTRAPWRVRWATGTKLNDAVLAHLTGHKENVWSVAAVVVNGRPIAISGSGDTTVRIWDLATGRQVGQPLTGHRGMVRAVAAGTLNRRPVAVSVGTEQTMRVWDLATGEPTNDFSIDHSGWVNAVAIGALHGHPIAVTVSDDRTARVWDLASGDRLCQPLVGHTQGVVGVAITALDDDPVAVTASLDATARIWDLATGEPIGRHLDHDHVVTGVATTTLDGHPVAVTTSGDNTVRVWDLAGCELVGRPLTGHTRSASRVAVSTIQGRPVAITVGIEEPVHNWAGEGYSVRVWDLANGQPAGHLRADDRHDPAEVATATLNGRPVAITAGYGDRAVRVWDLAVSRSKGGPLVGHSSTIRALATTTLHGVPVAVSAGNDETIRIWDIAAGQLVGDVRAGPNPITTMAIATLHDLPIAIIRNAGGTASRLWDLTTGDLVGEIYGLTQRAVATTILHGHPVVVSGGGDYGESNIMRIWDLETGEPIDEFLTSHNRPISALANTTLHGRPVAVTGSSDSTIRIWDLDTGQPIGQPIKHGSMVIRLATTTLRGWPIAVTAGHDHMIRSWDLTTRQPIGQPLRGHAREPYALVTATLQERPLAITGCNDHTVRIWDLAAGREAYRPLELSNSANALSITPNGDLVVGFGNDLAVFQLPVAGRDEA